MEKRKNARSSRSYCCPICHQYHQIAKAGKCKYITGQLPVFGEFLRRFDKNVGTKYARLGYMEHANGTENAIKRIMGILMEHTEDFERWSNESSAEISSEYNQGLLGGCAVPPPSGGGGGGGGGGDHPLEADEFLVYPDPVIPAPEATFVDVGEVKGPAPPHLTFVYLMSLDAIVLT
jgi:hypothetical protein